MTTPTTPAGWYPDPEDSGGLRYWDGAAWTEHRAPVAAAATPAEEPADEFPASEQATSVVSLPEQLTTVVPTRPAQPPTSEPDAPRPGSHRAPDPEPEPEPTAVVPTFPPAAPSFEPPPTPTFEVPTFEEISAPTYAVPKHDAPPAEAPSFETPSFEAPPAPTFQAPPAEPPTYAPPSFETPSYAAASFETPPYGAPSFETPPYGAPPAPPGPPFASGGGGDGSDSRKLLIGFLSVVGVLLVILVLVLVYAFVIRGDKSTQIALPSSSASSTTTSSPPSTTPTTESETSTPSAGGDATVGDFVFSVASTDTGDTITSPIDDSVVKAATGEYYVVYLNIGNNGAAPLTWLSVLQLLSDGNQTFPPDVEASAALSGTEVTINPGEQLETALAFDVPVGTTPTSIQLHGVPGDPGVELPVS